MGAYEIVALRDARGPFFMRPEAAFPEATADDWARARRVDPDAFGADGSWVLDFVCYAIRRPGGRCTLVDAGVGPAGSPASSWAPVPGRLPELLVREGIPVADVDTVVLTHLHADHVGWSVRPDGTPTFPHARYAVQRTELAALSGGDGSLRDRLVDPLRRAGQLDTVDGEVCLSRAGTGAAGRITTLPTPGHTPGHQSVLVEGARDEPVLVTGDVLVHAVQLVAPEVAYEFESDRAIARATRRALLDRAVAQRALLATAHLTKRYLSPPLGGSS